MSGSIEKRGENAYRLTVCEGYRADGKKLVRHKTVRLPEGLTDYARKRRLDDELTRFNEEIRRGEVPEGRDITMAELIQEYIDVHCVAKGNARQTMDGYRHLAQKEILPRWGRLSARKLTPRMVQQFYAELRNTPAQGNHRKGDTLSGNTIHHYHTFLRALMNYAVRQDYIAKNPIDRVEAPRLEEREPTIYTPEQCRVLIAALEKESCTMRAGILLALLGQMRKGEICALNWEDVDLESGCIRVKHSAYAPTGDRVEIKAPKTRRSRRQITLPEGVVAALRALQEEQAREKVRVSSLWEDSGAVFVDYTGKRLHPTTIPQRFQKILEENNLPHIRFHDLRHTGASILFMGNTDVQTLSARLGHSKPSVTMNIYGHPYGAQDKIASDFLQDTLFKTPAAKGSRPTKEEQRENSDEMPEI